MKPEIYVVVIVVLMVFLFYLLVSNQKEMLMSKNSEVIYEMGTAEELANEKFKVQYKIVGLNGSELSYILQDIQRAVATIERMITHTTPVRPANPKIKDIFFIIEFIDMDDDLCAQTGINEYAALKDSRGNILNVYPTEATIELDKKGSQHDSRYYYDPYKFPWARNKSRLYYLLIHEMLHGLGVGGMWLSPDESEINYFRDHGIYKRTLRNPFITAGSVHNWIQYTDKGRTNPYFSGPAHEKYGGSSATNYYYRLYMGQDPYDHTIKLPLEDDGDNGTRLWHWDQGIYKNDDDNTIRDQPLRFINKHNFPALGHEVMVGWDILALPPVITTMTIANLEDLGYQVDYSQAEISTHQELQSSKRMPYLAMHFN